MVETVSSLRVSQSIPTVRERQQAEQERARAEPDRNEIVNRPNSNVDVVQRRRQEELERLDQSAQERNLRRRQETDETIQEQAVARLRERGRNAELVAQEQRDEAVEQRQQFERAERERAAAAYATAQANREQDQRQQDAAQVARERGERRPEVQTAQRTGFNLTA
jgi:hypothetical protein